MDVMSSSGFWYLILKASSKLQTWQCDTFFFAPLLVPHYFLLRDSDHTYLIGDEEVLDILDGGWKRIIGAVNQPSTIAFLMSTGLAGLGKAPLKFYNSMASNTEVTWWFAQPFYST